MKKNITYQIPINYGYFKFKSCDRKNKYLNIDEAMIQGKYNMVKANKQLFIYFCKICNNWHLTSNITKYKVI